MCLQLITPRLFRCYRWAAFRQVVDDIDKSVKAYWVAIRTSSFYSISAEPTTSASTPAIVVWISESGFNLSTPRATLNPPRSLRLDEWSSLCNLVDVINKTYTSLDSALPCYYGDDHTNQPGWLNCIEYHPFHVSLSQSAVNSIAQIDILRHCDNWTLYGHLTQSPSSSMVYYGILEFNVPLDTV